MKIDLTDSFWGENGEDELRIYTETTTCKIASQFCPAPHRGRALPFPPRAQVWGLPRCSKGHTSHTLGALTAQCTPDFQPWEQRSGRPGTDCSQLFLLHRGLLSRKAGWSFPQLWACYASRAWVWRPAIASPFLFADQHISLEFIKIVKIEVPIMGFTSESLGF